MEHKSLLLNTSDWDIHIGSDGNIKTTQGAYCTAQDVANAIQLFTNDAYLFTDRGVPHFLIELGLKPALSVVRSRFREAAEAVENVASAEVTITDITSRTMNGYIDITTEAGETARVEI